MLTCFSIYEPYNLSEALSSKNNVHFIAYQSTDVCILGYNPTFLIIFMGMPFQPLFLYPQDFTIYDWLHCYFDVQLPLHSNSYPMAIATYYIDINILTEKHVKKWSVESLLTRSWQKVSITDVVIGVKAERLISWVHSFCFLLNPYCVCSCFLRLFAFWAADRFCLHTENSVFLTMYVRSSRESQIHTRFGQNPCSLSHDVSSLIMCQNTNTVYPIVTLLLSIITTLHY